MTRTLALLGIGVLFGATACGDDSLNGGKHDPSDTGGGECETLADCGAWQVCIDGTCTDVCDNPPCDGSNGGTPGGGDPGSGTPGGGTPGGGTPGGGTPGGGTTPPAKPPWVGGQWKTDHHFDWSDYLGPLADLGGPIDMIDQLFMGTSEILDLPVAGDIIRDIIEDYVPYWVRDLVHILNNIIHFFQDVRLTGTMTLTHVNGAPASVYGTEALDWGYVQIIDGCPLGESDPNYPACATVAIPLNLLVTDFGTIEARAKPFSGAIAGNVGQACSITFTDRRVELEVGQFVNYVLNMATQIATDGQFQTFGDALLSLIDCGSVASDLNDFMCDNFSSCSNTTTIEQACEWAAHRGVELMQQQLAQISVDWDAMKFNASAPITYTSSTGNATALGTAQQPGQVLNGDFELLLGADLSGHWTAKRP